MSFYLPILIKLIHCVIYIVCIITISIVSVVIVISIHIDIIVTVVITIISGIISNFLLIASTFLYTALIRRTTAWCTSWRVAAITASWWLRAAGWWRAMSRGFACICTRWFMQITVADACLLLHPAAIHFGSDATTIEPITKSTPTTIRTNIKFWLPESFLILFTPFASLFLLCSSLFLYSTL